MKDQMLNLHEIADITGQSYTTTYNNARKGEFRGCVRIGSQYRVPKSQLFKQFNLVGEFDTHVEDKMLTIAEFSKLVKIGKQTVRNSIASEELQDFHKLGGSWFISLSNATKLLGLNYIFDGDDRTEDEKRLDDVLEQARAILQGADYE